MDKPVFTLPAIMTIAQTCRVEAADLVGPGGGMKHHMAIINMRDQDKIVAFGLRAAVTASG